MSTASETVARAQMRQVKREAAVSRKRAASESDHLEDDIFATQSFAYDEYGRSPSKASRKDPKDGGAEDLHKNMRDLRLHDVQTNGPNAGAVLMDLENSKWNQVQKNGELLMGRNLRGVRVHFPYARPMVPQMSLMGKVIKSINESKHALLESPTGTGKTVRSPNRVTWQPL
jgi:hypothetical protein